jgi:DNA replication protein DnaC
VHVRFGERDTETCAWKGARRRVPILHVSLSQGGPLLFQFCADRYEKGSLLITTNLEFARWTDVFHDVTLTTALLDRLTHHSHILVFEGESYRFRESQRRSHETA